MIDPRLKLKKWVPLHLQIGEHFRARGLLSNISPSDPSNASFVSTESPLIPSKISIASSSLPVERFG